MSLTQADIDDIKRDAEKAIRRSLDQAAEDGAFVPTPTPGASGTATTEGDLSHTMGEDTSVDAAKRSSEKSKK